MITREEKVRSPKVLDERVHLITLAQVVATRKQRVRHTGFVIPVHLSDARAQAHLND